MSCKGPLAGKTVLVTRPRVDATAFAAQLEAVGARVSFLPLIACESRALTEEMRRTFAQLHTYDWLVFTSVNGVRSFFQVAGEIPPMIRVAAVGSETAKALKQKGITEVLTPSTFDGDALAFALCTQMTRGTRVLVLRGQLSRQDVSRLLRAHGIHVDELVLYDTVLPQQYADDITTMQTKYFDYVTLFSSSAARHFYKVQQKASVCAKTIACIGARTARTAHEHGLSPLIVADMYTAAGLLQAIQSHARSEQK